MNINTKQALARDFKFRTGCDVTPKHEAKTWSWIHEVQFSLNEQSEVWKELYTWREFDIKSQFAIQYLEKGESYSRIHSFNNFIK